MECGVAVKTVILPAAILLFQSNHNNRPELENNQPADTTDENISDHLPRLALALTCAQQAALAQHHEKP